ncbi:hypothetical protein U8047_006254 [Pseudomonas aeruginosa]|uniref:hypothetical protein n=1 Tax=Pseudomonas aeruginosa TaxID=287 RepID=UPI001654B435|nr:hypothetical protein [Pseudomonas aeruginosa]EMB2825200.1 hypothetical protein [Pseudomonas aeruginosa]
MTEEEHDAKLRAEAQALREEVAEYEALCNRQAELLSQSIVAIRGPEPELTRWGYADLPLRVKTIVEEVAALRARVVVPDGYALMPLEPSPEMRLASHRYKRKNKVSTGPGFWRAMAEAAPRLNGLTVSASALDTLRKAALGEVQHLNNGLCPDAFEGHEARDPDCPVCRALIETGKESDNV